MAEWQHVEFTSSHKGIKNTSTNGTVLAEHLLNTGRGPWTPERTGKDEREKRKEEEAGQDLWVWVEGVRNWRRGEVPAPRGSSSLWGDQLRQKKMLAGKSLRSMKEPLNSPQIAFHMLPGGHHWEALKEDTGLPHTSTCQAR